MGKKSYDWKFAQVGGVTRVKIETGDDIAHLPELDQKLWTVLSCPVKGLEIDEKTLEFMDTDHDDKIRVNEVIETTKWLTAVLKTPDVLLRQEGKLALSDIDCTTDAGLKIYNSAKQILRNLGVEKDEIALSDTADSMAVFANTKLNGDGVVTESSTDDTELKAVIAACVQTIGGTPDRSGIDGVTAEQVEAFYAACADYVAWQHSRCELPYGDNTEVALQAYTALKDKVDDYFVRCKLVAFDADASSLLDVSAERMGSISDRNLADCMDEIATYPLARVGAHNVLALTDGINPAWMTQLSDFKRLVIDVDFPAVDVLTENDWLAIAAKFAPYIAWKQAKTGDIVEPLGVATIETLLQQNRKADLLALIDADKALAAEAESIQSVDKLLHLCRDFYVLIKNFVTFSDFYARNQQHKAIFQAGTLYIDQRSCDLCLKVNDMAKHNIMAAASGMFLIYCDCYSKTQNATMQIVAVMTNGEVNNLTVGKNAIFYDRSGLDWDATVTKIVDNPISIGQAFWSPYRRISVWIENLINKRAAEKDSEIMADATSKLSTVPESTPADGAATPAQPFDIAKFAGIFAALGMALGMIGTALVSVAKGFAALTWWQMPLVLLALLLLISGPSMIMAWLKLRKRNLAPILNANGWAVNANVLVNILFGATLTKMAVLPKLKLQDPFARKGMPMWRKILYIVLAVLIVGVVVVYVLHVCICPNDPETASTICTAVDSLAVQ
ncbi:MAG: hypothetical protein ACI392_06075 [Paludibacteraceae bacterium]